MFTCIDINALRRAETAREPYNYLVGSGFIRPKAQAPLLEGFPAIRETGFLAEDDVPAAGLFKTLLEELRQPEVSAIVSEKIDIDLTTKPSMITIRRWSAAKDGRIHTDGPSKIATMLIYLNATWGASPEGRLRVLRGPDNFDAMTAEIDPTIGTVFAFRRSDHSWHGHKPFVGERRVVQMAWLSSIEDVARKRRRGGLALFLKRLNPFGRRERAA